jgi:hypothetical protein
MFSSPVRPELVLGRPSFLFNGYRFLFFPWVKRLGRKANCLTPHNADARNNWSFGFTPHILLCLDKKNLPFTVIFRVLLGLRINFCMNFLLLSIPSSWFDDVCNSGWKIRVIKFLSNFSQPSVSLALLIFVRIFWTCRSYLNATEQVPTVYIVYQSFLEEPNKLFLISQWTLIHENKIKTKRQ